MRFLRKAYIALFLLILLPSFGQSHDTHKEPIDDGYNYEMISNSQFRAKDTMSEVQIQNFLNSHNSGLSRYVFDQDINIGVNNDISARGKSAATIINIAAQSYGINPQILLAFLQKESSGVTNSEPMYLASAMGFACPESRPCDSRYQNFAKQIDGAAFQLDFNYKFSEERDYSKIGEYYAGNTARIDGKNTLLSNSATAALYRYTPHRPDSAYETATNGSHYYGNYNFIKFFYGWFVPEKNMTAPLTISSGELTAVINSIKDDLAGFDAQTKVINAEINNLQEKINQNNQAIADSEAKIEKQNKFLSEYIKNDYINNQTSIIELFFTSKSFSEFNSRRQYLNSVRESVQRSKQNVSEEKTKIEKVKTDLQISLDQQSSLRVSLNQQTEQKKAALASMSGSQKANRDRLVNILTNGTIKCGERNLNGKSFAAPVDCGYIAQGYGMTSTAKNGNYGGMIHHGIDITASLGSKVYPIGSGKVYATGSSPSDGWGNWIIINHGNGKYSFYAHLLAPSIYKTSASVSTNDVIGNVGGTPYWPAHLHLSLYDGYPEGWDTDKVGKYPGNTIDPLKHINNTLSISNTDWDEKYKH
jgi:murein DD-endopeptidase MepM/ murein hydrolase activator NlpD